MSVVFIQRDFAHHGRHSGYKQLVRYVKGSTLAPSDLAGRLLQVVPDRRLYRLPPFHPAWYTRRDCALEFNVALGCVSRSGRVFHFLYGETSFYWSGYLQRVTQRRNRMVATYHQVPQFFEQRRHEYRHLQTLDAVILVSSNQRAFFESMVGPEIVHVVPHGVDTEFFQPSMREPRREGPIRLLTVGSNYRDSRMQRCLIERLNRALPGELEFVIVDGSSAPDRFGHPDNVRFFSRISDAALLRCYQTADILLLPLTDATACNALVEGMACGVPAVVSDVGGVRDYVDEACAVLAPAGDSDALMDGVLGLLVDAEKREMLGRMARMRASSRFDWQQIARQTRAVYAKVL